MVEYLVQKGAEIEAKDYRKATALHYAAGTGHDEIVLFLISKGVNVFDSLGYSPLGFA